MWAAPTLLTAKPAGAATLTSPPPTSTTTTVPVTGSTSVPVTEPTTVPPSTTVPATTSTVPPNQTTTTAAAIPITQPEVGPGNASNPPAVGANDAGQGHGGSTQGLAFTGEELEKMAAAGLTAIAGGMAIRHWKSQRDEDGDATEVPPEVLPST